MIRKNDVRALFESTGSNPQQFTRRMSHLMGLSDPDGNPYRNSVGNPVLRDPKENGQLLERLKPGEFSLAQLGRGILGDDLFEDLYNPESRKLAGMRPILEATGEGAITASTFANINAFTAVVAGLLEVSVLEAWQNPEFIADQLAPAEATKMFDGRKVIGTGRVGDQAEERQPGMPTKRVQFGERWITQPRTVENSLACEVTQETVFLDLTGNATNEASDLGTWLGYRKEIRVIDAFIGVTNTYSYKGVAYNTYQAAGTWDNDFSNELLHYTNVEAAEIKFRDMKDPETGTRVIIKPNTMLVNREKLYTGRAVLGAVNVQYRDPTNAAQYIREFPNPVSNQYQLLESPLVFERCTAADGLNLSAVNAGKYWWLFERGKALKYAQNWPLRVQQAAPGQLDMIDRGIVLYVKADERGIPFWYEPRRVVRNKN